MSSSVGRVIMKAALQVWSVHVAAAEHSSLCCWCCWSDWRRAEDQGCVVGFPIPSHIPASSCRIEFWNSFGAGALLCFSGNDGNNLVNDPILWKEQRTRFRNIFKSGKFHKIMVECCGRCVPRITLWCLVRCVASCSLPAFFGVLKDTICSVDSGNLLNAVLRLLLNRLYELTTAIKEYPFQRTMLVVGRAFCGP